MIPELGHVALALALCLAVAQAFFGLAGPIFNKPAWSAAVPSRCPSGTSSSLRSPMPVLTYAHVVDDFSVAYVANHSNSALPMMYKVSGRLGRPRGLDAALDSDARGMDAALVGVFSRRICRRPSAKVLGVMG